MPTPKSTPQDTRRLASLETAADYADVSIRTVRRWISDGTIAGYRMGPRLVRVDLNDLDRMLEEIPAAK